MDWLTKRSRGASADRAPRKTPPATPGAALVGTFVAFSFAWFLVPWLFGLATASGARWYGSRPLEAGAQFRSIRLRLEQGKADDMNRIFPEGRLFSYAFYGFALVNVATADPKDAAWRYWTLSELERILPIVEAEVDAPAFGPSRNLIPKGGIIPEGQANLLRAGYALLGGSSDEIIRQFHDSSSLLHAEFMKSPVGSLESYPGHVFPVDNCCALESLRLHDVLYGSRYAEVCRRWADWMAAHLDAETGLMVARVAKSGAVVEEPRGCALSWSLAFMPGFAPELARSQYERYRSGWFVHVAGFTGVREWAPGREDAMDADSGPVVFGIGSAASGLGIAAAKANGDAANLTGMLRGIELCGLPLWSLRGKDYFLGKVLLADELALWGKTMRVWDRPPGEDRPLPWPEPRLGSFWLSFLLLLALAGAVLFFSTRAAARAVARAWRNPARWRGSRSVVFAIEAATLAAWLLVPGVTWLLATLLVASIGLVESTLLERRRRTAHTNSRQG